MDHILLIQLRDARRSMGLSQAALAARLSVTQQVVKRLETGIGSVPTLVEAMAAVDFQLTGIGPGATLSDQLRGCRQKKGWSLEALAKRSGLSRATIAALERGQGSVRSLLRLLTALAPKARRRAPERAYWGAGDKIDRDPA
jgi:transcriptional regulator with XRE-family HTH domain